MHGSKKWITDYRGRIKRSNNRTKLDYYAGLKAWDSKSRYVGWFRRKREKSSCPQCRHVEKAIQNDLMAYYDMEVEVRKEWKALYGETYWIQKDGKTLYFRDYFRQHRKYVGFLWHYDPRNYLCYKHERMYEQERAMWDAHLNGTKQNYRWSVKHERQKYRRKVKNLMQRAKYDEELYEDIPRNKRGWLD
jgi:hypothetical protein